MLQFLLTSWWLYIPIIGLLLFLTHRNNQKLKAARSNDTQKNTRLNQPKSTRIRRAIGRLGLSGAAHYFRR